MKPFEDLSHNGHNRRRYEIEGEDDPRWEHDQALYAYVAPDDKTIIYVGTQVRLQFMCIRGAASNR